MTYAIGDPVPMLYRCTPDGASQELLLTLDTHNYVRGLALDPVGGKIYWSSSDGYVAGNGKIRRANLDGTGVEDLVTGMIYPYGIALDMATGKMFWIRQEVNSIWRANLDTWKLHNAPCICLRRRCRNTPAASRPWPLR